MQNAGWPTEQQDDKVMDFYGRKAAYCSNLFISSICRFLEFDFWNLQSKIIWAHTLKTICAHILEYAAQLRVFSRHLTTCEPRDSCMWISTDQQTFRTGERDIFTPWILQSDFASDTLVFLFLCTFFQSDLYPYAVEVIERLCWHDFPPFRWGSCPYVCGSLSCIDALYVYWWAWHYDSFLWFLYLFLVVKPFL